VDPDAFTGLPFHSRKMTIIITRRRNHQPTIRNPLSFRLRTQSPWSSDLTLVADTLQIITGPASAGDDLGLNGSSAITIDLDCSPVSRMRTGLSPRSPKEPGISYLSSWFHPGCRPATIDDRVLRADLDKEATRMKTPPVSAGFWATLTRQREGLTCLIIS
jgi:hypothetical protein